MLLRALTALLLLTGMVLATSTGAEADLDPPTNTLTIPAGGSATEAKTITVPGVPPAIDIEIAIDTTGSMADEIAQAKADATALVNAVKAIAPQAQIAVVEFRDSTDSVEYRVAQSMTEDATAVQTAVDSLFASGGGNFPEAYNLVFRNSYDPATGGDIGWRNNSRKFVVVIGDAPPHGSSVPECSATATDPNGLVTTDELAGMVANQRTLFMVYSSSGIQSCYDAIAALSGPGSQSVALGGSLDTQVVDLIEDATSVVADLRLDVASASPAPADASWVSFSPPLTDVPAPSTQNASVTVDVPAGTPAGSYVFEIVALADGGEIGRQTLTVVVPDVGGGDPCDTLTPTIEGTDGPDTIYGTAGDDIIFAKAGNDRVWGRGGNDIICLGEGADIGYGQAGNDVIYGGPGRDGIYGSNGADELYGEDGQDILDGGSGDDVLDGAGGEDELDGGRGDDTMSGGDQDDLLLGRADNDVMSGGNGDDDMFGHGGNDTMTGGEGNDRLVGAGGDDSLDGGPGPDELEAGAGTDTCVNGDVVRGCEL